MGLPAPPPADRRDPVNRTTAPFLLLLLAACSSEPIEPYSSADLQEARELYAQGELLDAYNALEDLKREYFDRPTQGEYSLLAGDIAYDREDWDRSIHHYEEYLLFAGVASEAERVEGRLYEMGLDLLEGERKAFGIFTDRTRGIVTLHNLAAWAPSSPWAPQALATAANYSFDRGEYNEAAIDYRLLLEQHAGSEFTDLATYRLGMCGYLQIDGPWVDRRLIEHSAAQLRHYLRHYPTGLFREDAQASLTDLERLGAERELMLGDYYARIGNVRGARLHYQAARTAGIEAVATDAEAKLAALPPNPPLAEPEVETSAG